MNKKVWAKLKLNKNADGSIIKFTNPEKSDITDLRIFEIYEVSDEFSLVKGDKIYLYNTANTIEYMGVTNNSLLFKCNWGSVQYATIPFDCQDIRICTYASNNNIIPIQTEAEYGTDLNFALTEFSRYLGLKENPIIYKPYDKTVYFELDGKMTSFVNENAIKKVLISHNDDETTTTIYRYTDIIYGVFIEFNIKIDEYNNRELTPILGGIYCEDGCEKELTDRLLTMVNGELDRKIKIALM